ncbi:hypothetical protein ACWOBE_02315 [Hutsoniella sourekii]
MSKHLNEYEQFLKIQLLLEQNQLDQACYYLEQLYQANQDPEVFNLWITSLLEQNKYTQAYQLFDQWYIDSEQIYEDQDRLKLWLETLFNQVHPEDYLIELYQVREYLQVSQEEDQWLDDYFQEAHQLLGLKRQLAQATASNSYQGVVESLLASKDQTIMRELRHLMRLGLDAYPVILDLLANDQLANYLKTEMLEWLLDQGVSQEVTYSWFGQIYQLDLSRLVKLSNMPIYKRLMRECDQLLSDQDPNLIPYFKRLIQELSKSAYPFVEDVIPDFSFLLSLNGPTPLNQDGYFLEAMKEAYTYGNVY